MKLITGWLTCKQGMREAFLAAMEPHVVSTRAEPGCVFFECHRHKDEDDVVVLIEGFRDAEAHEFHRRTPHMIAMQADVRRLLARLSLIETVSDEVARYDLDFIANSPAPYRP
jgi:quinol monooxygenase YgiN